MSRPDTLTPPSLAQHFEPPEEFKGCFGWLCGYSADVPFLNDAAERFSRLTQGQRAYTGRILLALMLDPSSAQIPPTAVPGVLHLPLRPGASEFRLLHAKIALLGFRHESDARQWQLRLIVTTGNWTRQTLEESLDLAWCIDLRREDLHERDASVYQACADFRAALDLLTWLRQRFDTRFLSAKPQHGQESDTMLASRSVEDWVVEAARGGRSSKPRFFDSRRAALLDQLPSIIRHHSGPTARNYLALGSGFYESTDGSGAMPSVLQRIVSTLQKAGLVTQFPEIDVFVNPKACQAVAHSVPSFAAAGWSVRDAQQPAYLGTAARSLHAKFIFSAGYRDNSVFCNSAWLYLGSGNLTGPGFANPMTAHGGNLEAGVLIAPESLRWFADRHVEPASVLTNLLPLQWDHDLNEAPGTLKAGSDMPEPQVQYQGAPVAYLHWIADGQTGWLTASEDAAGAFNVLDDGGRPCDRDAMRGFRWPGPQPRQVTLRFEADGQEQRALVPVIDEFGRIAATMLPVLGIDEAWGQLANFPMPPEDEELPDDGHDGAPGSPGSQGAGTDTLTARYPVRQMMQLIENVAAKQTSVSRADWTTWCTRLEQCLIQMKGSKVLEEFLRLGLNPISPLWHTPFRPPFAATVETNEGSLYEGALRRIEAAWNVSALARLGGPP
jgi:hypothetical protein